VSGGWADPAAAARWDADADVSPGRLAQLELLLAIAARASPETILELGVGSGQVAEALLERLPAASLVGVDGSSAMLELGRARLARFGDRVRLVEADLRDAAATAEPAALVVSVQALHHLDDPAKRDMWLRLGALLRAGSLVLVRDKVAVPAPLFEAYAAVWAAHSDDLPATATGLAAELAAKGDLPATLQDQLRWLEESGFDAGVVDVHAHYALVAARRRAS
jgi:tRNA (cmo5U34)-methyltransferase